LDKYDCGWLDQTVESRLLSFWVAVVAPVVKEGLRHKLGCPSAGMLLGTLVGCG
jgi:hypothetical protein